MIEVTIPMKIESESNKHEHWSRAYRRKKKQQQTVKLILSPKLKGPILLPAIVTLTRVSPRDLDSDNLQAGFKAVRDAIGMLLVPGTRSGQADGDTRIEWRYMQEKKSKTHECKITIKKVFPED